MLKVNTKYWRSLFAVVGVVVGFMVLAIIAPTQASSRNLNPRVRPPNSHPYGMTYGEWSARHWQWLYSMPVDAHPLFDTADCSEGQSGPVWFLGGTFAVVETEPNVVEGIVTRTCTVPVGKALFFPIIDAECATLEGNGTTDAELRNCAESIIDHATNLQTEIDGVAIQNLQAYRVQSPLFSWGPLPDNNVFQDPDNFPAGATSPSVSDGFFVMLTPLSAGQHTVHFSGEIVFTDAEDGFDFQFILDVTYHLTIAPRKL